MRGPSGPTGPGGHEPVVVGIDGSPSAQDALAWAVVEAANQGRPLRIVHADESPLRGEGERLLADAEARARSLAPGIDVLGRLVTGAPALTVLEQASDAHLVVLGSRGLGGFLGLLIGSVSLEVVSHAPCPVVVVRPRAPDEGAVSARRVVVGVDGSELSALAIGFAFRAAARRGVGVTAVRAWDVPMPVHASLLVPLDRIQEAERLLLAKSLVDPQREFPGVDLQIKLVNDHAGHALVLESAGAELLVVGSRGLGGFRGMLLGSVSQAVIRHSSCPVAVVHPRR